MYDDGENEEKVNESENWENTDEEVGKTHDEGLKGEEENSNDCEERGEIYMGLMVLINPLCFEGAMKSANWRLSLEKKTKSLEKNQTWTYTELHDGAKIVGLK
ncbi:hypothetical protein CR513_12688, partial [Mucuna pruriens]